MANVIKQLSEIKTNGSGWSSCTCTLEDGRIGDMLLGQNVRVNPFKVGDPIVFEEVNDPQYGLKFKKAKLATAPPSMGGGGRGKVNEAAISSNVAIDKAVSLVIAGKVEPAQMFATADRIFDWIRSRGGW